MKPTIITFRCKEAISHFTYFRTHKESYEGFEGLWMSLSVEEKYVKQVDRNRIRHLLKW